MWAMLLWALTLPGQEVDFYQFLISWSTPVAEQEAASVSEQHTATVNTQEVMASADARPATFETSFLQKHTAGLPSSFLHVDYAPVKTILLGNEIVYGVFVLVARRLPTSIQPNAP
ncbi:hypothetical protein GCM10023183_22950 [Nibribacter koreensis]|uniref:Uncharacterized protein n=2 Tax=Nibribacter koreensis TaxID=1084519 RepID=A0ABP8FMT6_9BACT